MDRIKRMLPYLGIIIVSFYLLPFLISQTGTAMFLLMVAIPAVCFVTAFIYGIKFSFDLLFVLLIPVLFIPTIYLHYNESAWIYVAGYAVLGLVGNGVGAMLLKQREPRKTNRK